MEDEEASVAGSDAKEAIEAQVGTEYEGEEEQQSNCEADVSPQKCWPLSRCFIMVLTLTPPPSPAAEEAVWTLGGSPGNDCTEHDVCGGDETTELDGCVEGKE